MSIITYNHKPYIAQAIEGALQQRTSFPFEIVIGEDCSTDGTRQAVFDYQKRFPDIVRVITSDRNVGAHANCQRVYNACSGTYVAYCDGDDYWQNPHKLQMQADFLETHPEHSLVHTDADWLVQDTGQQISCWHKTYGHPTSQGDIYEDLLVNNQIMTCTVCIRKESLDRFIHDPLLAWNPDSIVGDYPRWLLLSLVSQIGYLDVSTATRRELRHSASKSPDADKHFAFILEMYDIREHFMRLRAPRPRVEAQIRDKFHRERLKHGYLLQDPHVAGDSYRYLAEAGLLSLTGRLHFLGSKGRVHHTVAKTLIAVKDRVRSGQNLPLGRMRKRRAAG